MHSTIPHAEQVRICPHWGICGGCSLLSDTPEGLRAYPYAEELSLKEEKVLSLLKDFEIGEWRPILGSPEQWYYRNKMEYAFGAPDARIVPPPVIQTTLGLRKAGKFNDIID